MVVAEFHLIHPIPAFMNLFIIVTIPSFLPSSSQSSKCDKCTLLVAEPSKYTKFNMHIYSLHSLFLAFSSSFLFPYLPSLIHIQKSQSLFLALCSVITLTRTPFYFSMTFIINSHFASWQKSPLMDNIRSSHVDQAIILQNIKGWNSPNKIAIGHPSII